MNLGTLLDRASSTFRRRQVVPTAPPPAPETAAPPPPAYHAEIDASDLRDYQKYQLKGTIDVIHRLFPDEEVRRRLRVLDIGCSPDQDRYLSRFVGHVSGTNLDGMQDEASDEKSAFFNSGETALPFADGAFDFAFSLSVMEHLRDTRGMLAEHARVVRPGGYGYMEWCAQWGCYAGHHVFATMMRNWERELNLPRTPFEDDGEILPNWGHLLFVPEQLHRILLKRLGEPNRALVDKMVDFVYVSENRHGLSRMYLDEVMEIVRALDVELFEFKRMEMPATKEVRALLEALHGEHDYDAHYAAVIFKKPDA